MIRERRSLSRREFVGNTTAAIAMGAVWSAMPSVAKGEALRASAEPLVTRAGVMGFHMDRLYFDLSGMAEPYDPPHGTRSGQAIADLSDEEFYGRHPYF